MLGNDKVDIVVLNELRTRVAILLYGMVDKQVDSHNSIAFTGWSLASNQSV